MLHDDSIMIVSGKYTYSNSQLVEHIMHYEHIKGKDFFSGVYLALDVFAVVKTSSI